MFREQTPNQGRWISPDPAGVDAVSLTDPQSWNRYGYVADHPLTSIDPLGLDSSKCLDVWFADSHAECGSPGGIWGSWIPGVWIDIVLGGRHGGGGGGGSGSDGGGGGTGGGGGSGAGGGQWPNGERLGIPYWLPLPQGNLTDFLLPGADGCDFGPCGPGLGSGFNSGAITWGTVWEVGKTVAGVSGAALLRVLSAAGSMLFLEGDSSSEARKKAIEKYTMKR